MDVFEQDQFFMINSTQTCSQFWSLKLTDDGHDVKHPQLESLLQAFKDVFEEPTSLPPHRPCDHTITLQHGSDSVNQKAYKYGVSQKNVIEEMVQEMLKSGIIRPSHSNFASKVVLVKKKDGTWRFCVDYRKLNHLTIKDQFPIPIVEELND